MAVDLNPPLKLRFVPRASEPSQYRRKSEKRADKKIQRRFRVKIGHAALGLALIIGLFLAVQEGFFYLIGWERLDIDRIVVSCRKPELRTAAADYLRENIHGNLMLLDIQALRRSMEAHPWIETVRVRKHFPSTLRVEIMERIPAAYLTCDPLTLIDRRGVELSRDLSRRELDLPLFMDDGQFRENRDDRIRLAWRFMESLEPRDRMKIDTVDISCFTDLRVKRKDFQGWLLLGKDRFSEKMKNFHAERRYLEDQLPLAYVDLSRTDQIALKPLDDPGGAALERR